jgi:hypothetical protein
MTSVRRPYINTAYNQKVDDGCLEYKSIPMAVVNDIVKVSHEINDFTGIKQIYNLIPPRPKNINAMATSIARINNLPYSVVDGIAKKFIADEVAETRRFVASAPSETLPEPLMYEPYITENPTQSSTGSRLAPEKETNRSMVNNPKYNRTEQVSFILGDLNPTSGVVPFNVSNESQTEWVMSKEKPNNLFEPVSREYGLLFAGSSSSIGGMGYKGVGLGEPGTNVGVGFIPSKNLSDIGHYREGTSTQTTLSKPPSNKNMTGREIKTRIEQTFYQDPYNRQGTFEGTPTRHLNRDDKIERLKGMVLPHTPKTFKGDSATSGFTTPLN